MKKITYFLMGAGAVVAGFFAYALLISILQSSRRGCKSFRDKLDIAFRHRLSYNFTKREPSNRLIFFRPNHNRELRFGGFYKISVLIFKSDLFIYAIML